MGVLQTMSLPEHLSSEAKAPLAERARAGDNDAFTELVNAYHARLYRYLFALVRHPEDASDLTQEVFLKVYKGLSRFNPEKPFEPWLFTIARRTAMSHFRKARKSEPISEDNIIHLHGQGSSKDSVQERSESVWELAMQLPPKLHQVLLLHYKEDFPVVDVARIMGITKIHTRVLLHRARTHLKELHTIQENA